MGWGEWNEMKEMIRVLLERQEKDICEIRDCLKWISRLVLAAVVGMAVNAILNLAGLAK